MFCRKLENVLTYAFLVLIVWGQICICAIQLAFSISAEDIDSLLAPLWRTYCLKYDEHVGEDDDEDEDDDDDEHALNDVTPIGISVEQKILTVYWLRDNGRGNETLCR